MITVNPNSITACTADRRMRSTRTSRSTTRRSISVMFSPRASSQIMTPTVPISTIASARPGSAPIPNRPKNCQIS